MLIYHFLEFIFRFIIKKINKPDFSKLDQTNLNNLNEKSYCVIENFLTDEECLFFINQIKNAEKIVDKNKKNSLGFWADQEKSDIRFFKFQKYNSEANQKILNNQFILNYFKAITGRSKAERTLMANHVIFKLNNKGSGGGWHRDTRFRTYFKAFIYLNDVDHSNGPLEIIEGSHKIKEILKLYKNQITKKEKFRFDNFEIQKILNDGFIKTKLLGKKGTLILANTKAIHRGSPLTAGNRFAFTIYFADPRFKKELVNLEQ